MDTIAGVKLEELPQSFSTYAPFTRVSDQASNKREVIGKATRGLPIDTYGTVITYEASKKAFARAGHIAVREMHQNKAVGKGLQWTGDDEAEDISLHSYISRAATDTWTKVEENILTGYSIKGNNPKYGTVVRNGKTVPAIVDYDLVEVSLVDNPSCPGCDIAIMRADGIEQVIASDEEVSELQTDEQPVIEETKPAEVETIERAGARISADSRDKLHNMRDQAMSLCGCDDCVSMAGTVGGEDGDEDMSDAVERVVSGAMAPVYARLQAYLGDFSRRQSDVAELGTRLGNIERALGTLDTSKLDKLDDVLGMIGSVKGQIERIAGTPMPGGPHTGKRAAVEQPNEHDAIVNILEQSNAPLTTQQRQALVARTLRPTRIGNL